MAKKMSKPWQPGKSLEPEAKKQVRRVADRIKAKKRKPHPSPGGDPGGSLARRVLEDDIIDVGKSHVAIRYSLLGQKFLWLRRGTTRQKKHSIPLSPKRADLRKAVEEDAIRHFSARDSKEAPRG